LVPILHAIFLHVLASATQEFVTAMQRFEQMVADDAMRKAGLSQQVHERGR
jgi:hypothetical protein